MSARAGESEDDLRIAHSYPIYVNSDEERRRWDLAVGIAQELFGDIGDPSQVWMAARSIYQGPIPTDA